MSKCRQHQDGQKIKQIYINSKDGKWDKKSILWLWRAIDGLVVIILNGKVGEGFTSPG